jgi:hypothetical protein
LQAPTSPGPYLVGFWGTWSNVPWTLGPKY